MTAWHFAWSKQLSAPWASLTTTNDPLFQIWPRGVSVVIYIHIIQFHWAFSLASLLFGDVATRVSRRQSLPWWLYRPHPVFMLIVFGSATTGASQSSPCRLSRIGSQRKVRPSSRHKSTTSRHRSRHPSVCQDCIVSICQWGICPLWIFFVAAAAGV